PADLPVTGPAAPVLVGPFPEVAEAAAEEGSLQEIAPPVVVNGRLLKQGETDRFRVLLQPNKKYLFNLVANRLGSPLDGVLTLLKEQGGALVKNDDRPDTIDPGFEYQTKEDEQAAIIVVEDLLARG